MLGNFQKTFYITRLYPAGQGSANRRYYHATRKATSGNVVDTSQTGHPFAGHFQAADTIRGDTFVFLTCRTRSPLRFAPTADSR